ncbi:MAG: hypothetical protein ACRENX_09250 [Candidatus Dormibacteria bacterium]
MKRSAEDGPPTGQPPRTFQGWQRRACLVLVGLLVLLAVILVVTASLGALGVR